MILEGMINSEVLFQISQFRIVVVPYSNPLLQIAASFETSIFSQENCFNQ